MVVVDSYPIHKDMKMKDNPASEAFNELADSSNNVTQLTELAIPYILHAFHHGIEGKEIVRLSIQRTPECTYKGVINAIEELDDGVEHGYVSFTRSDTVDGVLAYFEDALAYDEIEWRKDKFHENHKPDAAKSRSGQRKLKLTK